MSGGLTLVSPLRDKIDDFGDAARQIQRNDMTSSLKCDISPREPKLSQIEVLRRYATKSMILAMLCDKYAGPTASSSLERDSARPSIS